MSNFIDIDESLKDEYNAAVNHPMQSFEWGEFRKATNTRVIRRGVVVKNGIADAFTITLHPIPKLPYMVGYIPKTDIPSPELMRELTDIGKVYNCIFIQLEPNITTNQVTHNWTHIIDLFKLRPSFHPLFTKYTFILDLTKKDEELLSTMHHKTRYNIRVAQRHGVTVQEDNSDPAFAEYLKLTQETTKRQKFYAHTPNYHIKQWNILPHLNHPPYNQLSSHLLTAAYNNELLTAWILFVFKDTLYYPYGASSNAHRNTMHSNLIMWEAIKFGKKLGLTKFDMWGALSQTPNSSDPWYGFHRFKEGYGPVHTEFVGSYDFVLQPTFYHMYKVADKVRWALLRMKK